MERKLFNLLVTLTLFVGVLSLSVLVTASPAAAGLNPSVDPLHRIAPEPLPVVSEAAQDPPVDPDPPLGSADVGPVAVSAPLAPLSFDGSLSSLAAIGPVPEKGLRVIPAPRERYEKPYQELPGLPQALDPNRQTWHGEAPMPAPSLNFNGIINLDNQNVAGGMIVPPDSDGDVGPNHYIQTVNVVNRVYFKDGTPASPVFLLSQLWAAVDPTDPCAQDNHGDPIGLYDPMADRWVLTQFYIPGPYYECIAVSKTPDPVNGGWWLYTILTHPADFWDYPKVGVWPDAYYMTANMFPSAAPGYSRLIALERSAMLAGQPARQVTFDVFDGFGILPANVRGNSPPPGSPNYLLEARVPNRLRLYRFAVDWDDPASSTLTSTDLTVNFWNVACSGTRQCVPQLGTTNRLDALGSRLMQPLHYRRIVDGGTEIESLWANHTVLGSSGQTAVRWYEIRDPGGSPTVHQQGTYEPDSAYRWTGSLATDGQGNMALGYSASSSTIYPQIRYAGRLATDPLGVLAQDERTLIAGTTYQKAWSDLSDPRWGDYTAMSVDPLDDCTFWYTNQYYLANPGPSYEHYNWRMRIGAFRFPSCESLPAPGQIVGTVTDGGTGTPIGSAPIEAINQPTTRTYAGATNASGTFTLTVLPGTYTVTAGPLLGYPDPASVSNVVVTSGAVTRVDIDLSAFPKLIEAGVTVVDPAPGGNANGYPEPGESYIQLWEDLENTGVSPATGVSARLFSLTPGLTVITDTASYPDIPSGAVETNITPFGFSVDGGLACGSPLDFRKVISTDQKVFTVTFSLDAQIPGSGGDYISSDVPKAIPDNDTLVGTSSVIDVPDTFSLTDVDVALSIQHTSDQDLDIYLENPTGTRIALSTDNGGTGQNYSGTIFDDEAATPITAGSPPFTGRFRPEQPLSIYDGTSASGTWTLHLFDDGALATGQLVTWTLTLEPYVQPRCDWAVPILEITNTLYADSGGNSNGNGWIDPGENSIDLAVALENSGVIGVTNVDATIMPRTSGVTMNVAASAYPDIAAGAVQTNTTSYNFAVDSGLACGLPLDFELQAVTDQGTFRRDFDLPTGAPPVPYTLLLDDVESGPGLWTSGGAGLATWQITDEESHSPTHSWTEGATPGADYVNNADNWIQTPVYDLSGYDSVMLSFWHIYDLETDWDFGLVEVSRDGGITWETVADYTGYGNWTWRQETVDLGLAHEPNARLRFRFTSDTNTVGRGWHIDDIRIYGAVRQCGVPPLDWEKEIWINGRMYQPEDSPFTVSQNDIVTIVDRVSVGSAVPVAYTLTEEWPRLLDLSSAEADFGTLDVGADALRWTVSHAVSGMEYAITKTFTVNGDGGLSGFLVEELELAGFLPLQQVLEFNMLLRMGKDGPQEAYTGQVIPYTIDIEALDALSGTLALTDVLPAGVRFAGGLVATAGTARYDGADNAVYWSNQSSVVAAPALPLPTAAERSAARMVEAQPIGRATSKAPRPPLVPRDAVELVLDDGSVETNLGVTSGPSGVSFQFIWLNRFTPDPAAFPLTLQQIQVFFDAGGQGASPGDAIDLVVYRDTDGNPANGATWLDTINMTVQAADGTNWSTYNLDPAITISEPGDVLIGVINRYVVSEITPANYPAALDESASQRRSWVGWWDAGDPPDPASLPPVGTFALVDDLGLPGNWLIRGYGQSSGAASAINITFNVTVTAAMGDVVTNVVDLDANGFLLRDAATFRVPRPAAAWQKEIWINGDGPFTPADSPFRALLTTDTVTIVDQVWVTHTGNVTFSLGEEWSASLRLDGITPSGGSLSMGDHRVTWDVAAGLPSAWHVLTKTFRVASGNWLADAITESLTIEYALPQPDDIVLQFRHFRFGIYLPIALKND